LCPSPSPGAITYKKKIIIFPNAKASGYGMCKRQSLNDDHKTSRHSLLTDHIIMLQTYVRRGKSMKAAEDAEALAEEDPSGG
jgi:hypothetical protein